MSRKARALSQSEGAVLRASGRVPVTVEAIAVDAARSLVNSMSNTTRGRVKVLPPMRPGAIAVQSGRANASARGCLRPRSSIGTDARA